MPAFEAHGVIPACLLPFHDDLSIDEAAFCAHLRDVAATRGVTALTINAHASEVASCSFEEQRRVLAVAQDAVGARLPLVHGVYAEGSLEAARIARMAQDGGAGALLVFPPGPFTLGHSTAMAVTHYRHIADASDLPIILFQYPRSTGQGYSIETLEALFDAVPTIRAMKDWCNDPRLHERHLRLLHARRQPISMLSTHSAWLFSSLVLGCDGLLSGAGSVIAGLQGRLLQAVRSHDLAEARRINDLVYPLTEAFYTDPFVDMHNRMKAALVLLGKLPNAAVRPPLIRIGPAEIARLRAALQAGGMLPV